MYEQYNPVPSEYEVTLTKPFSYYVPYEVVRLIKDKNKFNVRHKVGKTIEYKSPVSRGELHKLIEDGIVNKNVSKYWFSLLHRLYPTSMYDLKFKH